MNEAAEKAEIPLSTPVLLQPDNHNKKYEARRLGLLFLDPGVRTSGLW